MTEPDATADARLEAALARALGPEAGDTAPLSRAVLSRIAGRTAPARPPIGEVLAAPLPIAAMLLAGLLGAGAIGHALVASALTEAMTVISLLGGGF